MMNIQNIGKLAQEAQKELISLTTKEKNNLLNTIAQYLEKNISLIKIENQKDLIQAKNDALKTSMIERLTLTEERIQSIIQAVKELIQLEDPIGIIRDEFTNTDGLKIQKISVPIGIIGIIYESRPNVTVDATSICFKSGNICILRGGKEARFTNEILVKIMQEAAEACSISKYFVQLLPQERSLIKEFITLDSVIDLIIPRGGEELIQYVSRNASVPVIKHYKGVCHLYLAKTAQHEEALKIIENAKCQRPGVCNALEALLIDKSQAIEFLPKLVKKIPQVELRASQEILNICTIGFVPATKEDWGKEYTELKLFVHIVESLEQAIDFINHYGSGHSDGILSKNQQEIQKFLQLVDSAVVYANASTRFTDGGVLGMGAEIGISTDKIHARGPMGLNELTSYKFIIHGNGHIRN